MKIITLIENTKGKTDCQCEHGLGIYIETQKHKLLVDTGATGAFAENADLLSVDLSQVDTVILSHGHYDHGGGLLTFTKQNAKAKIWMQKKALEAYYHKNASVERYIGLAPEIGELSGVRLIEGDKRIDEELFLFSGVTGRRLWPAGNLELKVKRKDGFVQDDFSHEQYLVVETDGKKILLSGCAHNGILNIIERFFEIYKQAPDVVLSGFHMQQKSGYGEEDIALIKETAEELKKLPALFYTGHCTGEEPYRLMKEIMGEKLLPLHSGEVVEIDG